MGRLNSGQTAKCPAFRFLRYQRLIGPHLRHAYQRRPARGMCPQLYGDGRNLYVASRTAAMVA